MEILQIKKLIASGEMVPYLGMGIYQGCRYAEGGDIPATNEALILAMNEGRAMAERYMVDYSRALMQLEQRKGRAYVEGMMNLIHSKPMQLPEILHKLVALKPPYLVDTGYDSNLQTLLGGADFQLILGRARIMAGPSRYEIYRFDAASGCYERREALDHTLRVLFKPMGSTQPAPTFICSDADFVDWLTEAMGGFALPSSLKEYRKNRRYLFLGLPFDRDTERMVSNEITLDLAGGVIVYEEELGRRATQFAQKHNLTHLKMSAAEFAAAL